MGRVVMCRVCYVPSLSWTECAELSLNQLYYGSLHGLKSSRTLCPRAIFFLFLLALALLICDHLAWRREGWSVCFSCICLFVLYVLVFVLFVFRLVSGVGYGL